MIPNLWQIFLTFFKIGGLTFGGGGVMIAWFEDEIVRKKNWLSDKDFLDYYAIAQCTPGIIAINVATLIGYHIRQKIGATVATVAVTLPSVIVITIFAMFLQNFVHYTLAEHAFNGVRAAVVALIVYISLSMLRQNVRENLGRFIFGSSFLLLVCFSLSPIVIILYGCVLGLLCPKIFSGKREKK